MITQYTSSDDCVDNEEDIGSPNPRPAKEIEDVEIEWVVDGLFPAGIILLGGQPGAGKSFLAIELACAISADRKFCNNWNVKKGICLYIDLEGELSETKRRVKRMVTYIPDNLYLDDKCVLEEFYIKKMIESYKKLETEENKIRLIVIDSLISSHNFKENSAIETNKIFRGALFPLKEAFPHTLILLIHHIRKPSVMDEKWTLFRGSGNILAQVRAGYLLLPVPDEGLAFECTKMRVGKKPDRALLEINDLENNRLEIVYKKKLYESVSGIEKCSMDILNWFKEIAKEIKEQGFPIERAIRHKREVVDKFTKKYTHRMVSDALEGLAKKGLLHREKKGDYVHIGEIEIQKSLKVT